MATVVTTIFPVAVPDILVACGDRSVELVASFLVSPIRDHAFFEQAVVQGEVRDGLGIPDFILISTPWWLR